MIPPLANIGTSYNQELIIDFLKGILSEGPRRYTVKIDKNNSNPYNRITYMHDAVGMTPAYMDFTNGIFNYGSWEDIWFIKGNYPVMLKSNGTVDYKLNPNDYTKKEDGSASDITNTSYDGNAMARFPKVYLSFREDNGFEYISVCKHKYDETYNPIGFINDSGNEVDEIFLAIYEGSNDSNNKLRSLSGFAPKGREDGTDQITHAKANGTGWYTRTWAQRQMVNALLTIISKSDNSQEAFGYGHVDSSAIKNTGTLNDKGQFFGYTNQSNAVKVFHMENWWGNMDERVAGLVFYIGSLWVKMHGPYNNNPANSTSTSGYTGMSYSALSLSLYSSYIANCRCDNVYGRLPINSRSPGRIGATSSTFLCDSGSYYLSDRVGIDYYYYASVGGARYSGLEAGAYKMRVEYPASYDYSYEYTGVALSFIS